MLVKAAVKGMGDGFISRHLNRKISTWVSALLVDFVSPNTMTVLTFLFGLLSVLINLWNPVVAGITCQISSILDGVDGELARAQLRTSRLGGYVDSLLDRYMDGAFLALLTYSTLNEPVWWPIALLVLLDSVMVSYSPERFKAGCLQSRSSASIPTGQEGRESIPDDAPASAGPGQSYLCLAGSFDESLGGLTAYLIWRKEGS